MLKPGVWTREAVRLQKRMAKKGVRYGLRRSLRVAGPQGLWIACLSQTSTVANAISLYGHVFGLGYIIRI